MPTVPNLSNDQIGQIQASLGDATPGPAQIMMAAATMHGYGRLLSDGSGAHSDVIGGGTGPRMPRRSKSFSQRRR